MCKEFTKLTLFLPSNPIDWRQCHALFAIHHVYVCMRMYSIPFFFYCTIWIHCCTIVLSFNKANLLGSAVWLTLLDPLDNICNFSIISTVSYDCNLLFAQTLIKHTIKINTALNSQHIWLDFKLKSNKQLHTIFTNWDQTETKDV